MILVAKGNGGGLKTRDWDGVERDGEGWGIEGKEGKGVSGPITICQSSEGCKETDLVSL
jgi:hypothetical protein